MMIAVFGESCTGKTTLADALKEALGGEIYTGKDYVRLSKDENAAKRLFIEKMAAAVDGENLIYVTTEKEQLALVPIGAIRILVTADIDTIKERFAARMRGNLPAPVAAMLERKHGCFDAEAHDVHVHGGSPKAQEVCELVKGLKR